MIQLISPGPPPSNPLFKRHCLSDPNMLLELSERAERSDAALAEQADRFSLILHDLRMAGAWKRTNRCRLRQTEDMLCAHLSGQFRDEMVFLDIGASDGVTTVEALRALRRDLGPNVRAFVADLNLWLLRYRRGPVVEYRSTDGEPIMVRVGPFGLRLADQRGGAAHGNRDLLAKAYLGWQGLRNTMRLDTSISLVNPLARSEPGLTIIELDCLRRDQNLVGQISAIRASNTLNPGYFAPTQIGEAVGHCHAYLRDGGCLVISRNADEPSGESENGSVWIRELAGFRRVADFGTGSEVRTLVDDWTIG